MKRYFLLPLISLSFLISCSSSDSSGAEDAIADTITQAGFDTLDMSRTIVNVPSLWKVEMEDDGSKERLEKPSDSVLASLTAVQMIQALNESYPDIQLQMDHLSGDTAYLAIPESTYLTQQTGSTGAFNYLATVVYNVTELKGVKYVHLNFKGGDHAVPGTYSRDNFKRLR